MKKFLKYKVEAEESFKHRIISKSYKTTDSLIIEAEDTQDDDPDILLSAIFEKPNQHNPLTSVEWNKENKEIINANIPLCKDYTRNLCNRVGCKYRHNILIEDLHVIYKFCKHYQNNICKYENCRFLHGTVVEQERFYRTGFLPDHMIPELKKREVFGLNTLDERHSQMPKYTKITPSDQSVISDDFQTGPKHSFERKVIKREWEDTSDNTNEEVVKDSAQQATKSIFQTGSREIIEKHHEHITKNNSQKEVIFSNTEVTKSITQKVTKNHPHTSDRKATKRNYQSRSAKIQQNDDNQITNNIQKIKTESKLKKTKLETEQALVQNDDQKIIQNHFQQVTQNDFQTDSKDDHNINLSVAVEGYQGGRINVMLTVPPEYRQTVANAQLLEQTTQIAHSTFTEQRNLQADWKTIIRETSMEFEKQNQLSNAWSGMGQTNSVLNYQASCFENPLWRGVSHDGAFPPPIAGKSCPTCPILRQRFQINVQKHALLLKTKEEYRQKFAILEKQEKSIVVLVCAILKKISQE